MNKIIDEKDILMIDKQVCDERHRRLEDSMGRIEVKLDQEILESKEFRHNISKTLNGNGSIGLCAKAENLGKESDKLRVDVDAMKTKVDKHSSFVERHQDISVKVINASTQILTLVLVAYLVFIFKIGVK